jgi:hypothetical protein
MLKKYVSLILFVLLASMLAVGCTDSSENSKQKAENNTNSIAEPPSSANGSEVIDVPAEPTPVETSVPASIPTQSSKSTQIIEDKGKLDILTNPAGATVIVDGISKGVSPVEGLSVDAGTHIILIRLSGYSPQKEKVEIANSETKKLFYTLDPEANENPTSTKTPQPTTKPKTELTPTSDYDISLVKSYDVIQENDLSMKAMTKPLSAYTPEELNSLPLNVRKDYRVVISPDISKEELKSTLIQVVMDKTSKNSEIDEVVVFAYDRKEDVNNAFTLGKVEWCPNGDWGSMTPEIASSNDRFSYQYVFDIKDKVGNTDTSDRPTEREYEIYDYYNKCFDAAAENVNLSDPEARVDEDLLMQKVAEKYGISTEEAYSIYTKVATYEIK